MLVDVVPLRTEGKKRPAEEVKAATPIRGHISIEPYTREGQIIQAAQLKMGTSPGAMTLLPLLDHVTIRRWQGADVILQGTEFVRRSGKPGETLPQAWWVRIIGPEAALAAPK